jgi:2-polyprenyl-3-methyl-5-hydroxy-6-metoxy-1,4-benzoquinol methylase
MYDWSDAPPPQVTTDHDVESEEWTSETEMAAHAEKARYFAARLRAYGLLSGATVLDIGCGHGHFLRECAGHGAGHPVGQEFRLSSMRYARERCGVIDVRSAPLDDRTVWPDGEFDLVCSFDVVEHVHDLGSFFEQCLRVLKRTGLMLHATPGSDSPTHRLGRLASRLGARRVAGTLCNVEHVEDYGGGPHVHLMGNRQVAWLARRHGLDFRAEYVASYSYSDRHYAAVVPQLRWMPRPLGSLVFKAARASIRNKMVFWARRAVTTVVSTVHDQPAREPVDLRAASWRPGIPVRTA